MEMQRPSGADEHDFHHAMAQLLNILLPVENPNRGNRWNPTTGNC